MVVGLANVNRAHMKEASRYLDLDMDALAIADQAALPDGAPIFFIDEGRPHPVLFDYGLHMAATLAPASQRQYAYTTKRFVDFLDQSGVGIAQVTETVLSRYRHDRLAKISQTSWSVEALVLRRLIDFMIETGRMDKRPWINVGQRNVLTSTVRAATNVRHLTAQQWLAFRDVGLRGLLPDGSIDKSFHCNDVERNVLGSEIAIGTGMRLAEFASLLTHETCLPQFTVQACAKRGTARDIYLVGRIRAAVDQYVRGTRRAIVHSHQDRYRRMRSDLLMVPDVDFRSGKVRLPGSERRVPLSSLSPTVRRQLFVDHGKHLEPAALFLGGGGLMLSTGAWSKVYRTANNRVASFPEIAQTARGVTAHDFRHTFAVRMMGHLVRAGIAAYQERIDRGENPQQTIGEAISLNPLTTVQHRLGHSSPSVTAIYLRYVEDLQAMIERVLVEWDDEVGELATASDKV